MGEARKMPEAQAMDAPLQKGPRQPPDVESQDRV